jgi:hypothetical protein
MCLGGIRVNIRFAQFPLFGAFVVLCAITVSAQVDPEGPTKPTRGLVKNAPGAFQGYTIVAPLGSTTTYLVDMEGRVVHEWKSQHTPTFGMHLLANGNLLRAARDPNNLHFNVGGSGGIVQEFEWDGTVVWEYVLSNRDHIQHHDIELMPNGNVMILAWERKSVQEVMMSGRDPQMITGLGLWPEYLIEIRPTRPKGGEIVWEWHLWDHLIQDRDPRLRNFGDPAEHPELVNINGDLSHLRESDEEMERLRALGYVADSSPADDPRKWDEKQKVDWNHANAISYNPKLDQIALSVLRFGEVWIIDRGTSTEEAAGHSGGKRGRGGDLLFRWGNPQTYRGPEFADQQQLFSQHDARWIPDGFPGAGNLTFFNNGRGRPDGEYSSVDEIRLPPYPPPIADAESQHSSGVAARVWSFAGSSSDRFFSSHISGAERLPNGNTLVCVGENGRIFEVTSEGTIVWDYLNPHEGRVSGRLVQRPPGVPPGPRKREHLYSLARAMRIAPDHPGLTRLNETTAR